MRRQFIHQSGSEFLKPVVSYQRRPSRKADLDSFSAIVGRGAANSDRVPVKVKINEKIQLQNLNILAAMTTTTLLSWILGPVLGVMTFFFIFRIVLTWYPQVDLNKFPFNIVAWPTEPFLAPLRKIVPPIGGVDITPILWVAIFSLLREILLGQQGLLTMMAMRG